MSAEPLKTSPAPTPPPTEDAHHGPGDGPSPRETIQAFLDRLKRTGWFSYKILGIAVFLVVAVIVWRSVSNVRSNASAREWMELEEGSLAKLEAVIKRDPNSYAGRSAQLMLTRRALDNGIIRLKTTTPKEQQDAIEQIEKARKDFQALAVSFAKDPVQKPECLWGLAKAEQALIGVPKKENSLQARGEVATAEKYFEQVAEAAGNTPLGQMAREQAALLKKNANEITALQTSLYTPFSFGGMPNDATHQGLRPIGPGGSSIPGIPGSSPGPIAPEKK